MVLNIINQHLAGPSAITSMDYSELVIGSREDESIFHGCFSAPDSYQMLLGVPKTLQVAKKLTPPPMIPYAPFISNHFESVPVAMVLEPCKSS